MTHLKDIKSAIEALSDAEFGQLREWFAEKDWGRWDAQLERDVEAGKLEFLLEEASAERK